MIVSYPPNPHCDINPRVAADEYCLRPGIPVMDRAVLLLASLSAGTGDGTGLYVGADGYEQINTLLEDECPGIDAEQIVKHHFGDIAGIKLFFITDDDPDPVPRRTNRKTISASRALAAFARDDYRCVHCGSRDNLTVDHIVPVLHGGSNDDANLQTLCRSCNSRKGARL